MADLSLGFYDLSCTTSLGNRPRVYDDETLQIYLDQISNNPEIDTSRLDLNNYGVTYLLGFHFAQATLPIDNGRKKMIGRPIALERKIVENSLPSQRDYGFASKESNPIYSNEIVAYQLFPVTTLPVGNRYSLQGGLKELDSNGTRLSLVEKHGFYTCRGDGYSRTSLIDTHKTTHPTTSELILKGYQVTKLDYIDKYVGQKEDGTLGTAISNKSAYGFDADKPKKTKVKISSGGGSKNPTYLSDYYAYSSRWHKLSQYSSKKIRFLVANGRTVFYQIENLAPVSIAEFITIGDEIVIKLNDSLVVSPGTELDTSWERCRKWASTYAFKAPINPLDYNKVAKDKKTKRIKTNSADVRLTAKLKALKNKRCV